MRQAVFSSLAARLSGAWFLDLFAGTGAYGLEAISRGAQGGQFVEKSRSAVQCIQRNVTAVARSAGVSESVARVVQADVLTAAWVVPDVAGPELVFVDPPYDLIADLAPRLFARIDGWVAGVADPVVVFEMPGALTLAPAGWREVKRLGKGAHQPSVAFFRRDAASAGTT